eukprot:Skav210441  [mRNA]  locus=scaffold1297:106258:108394:+ [translate_table: standard]
MRAAEQSMTGACKRPQLFGELGLDEQAQSLDRHEVNGLDSQQQCDPQEHHKDVASSRRLSQIKTLEDELMAKVFSLLQKLTPSRRLKLLQDYFSQTHRLALEAWVLAYRGKGQRVLPLTSKAASFQPCPFQGKEHLGTHLCQEAGVKALELPDGKVHTVDPHKTLAITDSEIQPPKAAPAARGIASFYRKGQPVYQVRPPLHTPQQVKLEDAVSAHGSQINP